MAKLTPDLEARILAMLVEKRYRRGATVRGAANIASYAVYLAQGASRLFYVDHGREHTTSFTFADEFVMLSRRLITEHPDTIAIQFLEDTTCVYVPMLRVLDLLDKEQAVEDAAAITFFNAALLHVAQTLDERLTVMQTFSAPQRLEWLTRRYPRILDVANITQIASYLGITKETIYRIRGGSYGARTLKK